MKAGLPQVIHLDTPQGATLSAPLTVMGNRAAAIFGEPQTPMVTRMELIEGEQRCTQSRLTVARKFISSDRTITRDPGPPQVLDYAPLANEQFVIGLYDGNTGTWTSASPAVRLYDTQIHMGEPRYKSLAIMKDCAFSMFGQDGTMAKGQCQFVRQRERISYGAILQMRCLSDGEINLKGVFTDMGQGRQYFPLDGATGKMINDFLR